MTPRAKGQSRVTALRPPFSFLSAITDGIPEPSEGTASVALKLERMDGIDLVSQRRGALSGFALQRGLYCAHGVARSPVLSQMAAGGLDGAPRCVLSHSWPVP